MKFHDTLNDKIWDIENDNQILPEVKDKLEEIASAFIEYLEIPQDAILDKVITGSSASYNYNNFSDLDLHIIVDYDKIHEDCPLVEGYLGALKNTFNKEHDIYIHGIPVELYAEKKDQGTVHNGLYSLNSGWVDFPEKIAPTDNDAAVEAKYQEIKEMVDKCDDSETATELLEKIYTMRKAGLASSGEFCTENLAFKKLRNEGCMDKLREIKKKDIDKQLSLESYNETLEQDVKELTKIDDYYKVDGSRVSIKNGFGSQVELMDLQNLGKKLEKKGYKVYCSNYYIDAKKNESVNEGLTEPSGDLAVFAKRLFSNVNGKPEKDFNPETDYRLSLKNAEKWINKDIGYDRPGIIYQIRDKEGNILKEVKWTDVYNTSEQYDEAIKYLYKYGSMDQIAYVLRVANPDVSQEKIDKKIEQLKAAKDQGERIRNHMYFDGAVWQNESVKEELEEKEYQGCKYTILPDGKYCSIKIYAPKGYSFKNGDTWYSTETELKKADKKAKDIIDNEIELKESIKESSVIDNFKEMVNKIAKDFKEEGYPKSKKFLLDFVDEAIKEFETSNNNKIKVSTDNGTAVLTLDDIYQGRINSQTGKVRFTDLENSNYAYESLKEDYTDIKPNTKQFDIVDRDGYSIDTLYVTPLENGHFDYWTDQFDSVSEVDTLKDIIDDVKECHDNGPGAEKVKIVGLNKRAFKAKNESIKEGLDKMVNKAMNEEDLKTIWKEQMKRDPIIDTPDGPVYLQPSEDGKSIEFGTMTNNGMIVDGSVEYDFDYSLDTNLDTVYDEIRDYYELYLVPEEDRDQVVTDEKEDRLNSLFTEAAEGIYDPRTILKAYNIEKAWIEKMEHTVGGVTQVLLFIINDYKQILDTHAVDKKDIYTYEPKENEYFLDRIRDTEDVITDYNLEPAQKLVDRWNESRKWEDVATLTDKVDQAHDDLKDLIKSLSNKIEEALTEPIEIGTRVGTPDGQVTGTVKEVNTVTKEVKIETDEVPGKPKEEKTFKIDQLDNIIKEALQ